jgi:hypothetical protein
MSKEVLLCRRHTLFKDTESTVRHLPQSPDLSAPQVKVTPMSQIETQSHSRTYLRQLQSSQFLTVVGLQILRCQLFTVVLSGVRVQVDQVGVLLMGVYNSIKVE